MKNNNYQKGETINLKKVRVRKKKKMKMMMECIFAVDVVIFVLKENYMNVVVANVLYVVC